MPTNVLIISGLLSLLLTMLATVFSFAANNSYIFDFIDAVYYARFIVIILGGFTVGAIFAYFSRKKQSKKVQKTINLTFTGLSFGLLAYSLYILYDYIRVLTQPFYGDPGYPWGKLIFEGAPLAALLTVLVLAIILHLKGRIVSASERWFEKVFVGVFIAQIAAALVSLVFILQYAEMSDMTLLIGLLNVIVSPLAIAAVAYFSFKAIKQKTTRLFVSSYIAMLYAFVQSLGWEFRTNPEYQATLIFSTVLTVVTYLGAMAVIFLYRRALLKK
ncbi:MAG: hypothetical protein WAQ27_01150 [Candidatus Microsaccharimonas sp.]